MKHSRHGNRQVKQQSFIMLNCGADPTLHSKLYYNLLYLA